MKKLILTIALSMGMVYGTPAKHNFNKTQKDNMQYACDFAKKVDIEHDDLCYVFSALVWQESSAGMIMSGGKGHKAYGLFQNYLPTIKARFKQKGIYYSDREIINLLNDKHFSATFAQEELEYWLDVRNDDMFKALASYNAGWKWRRGEGYAKSIMRKVNYLKKHGDFLEI